jgi:hypothetical protein
MEVPGSRFIALGALAGAMVLGGCVFPNFAGLGLDDDDFDGLQPSVLAVYSTGSATLNITQAGQARSITLERIGRGSQLTTLIGSSVTWRNDEGWSLTLNAYDFGSVLRPESTSTTDAESYSADLSIQLIEDHEFWRAEGYGISGNRCIVDVAEASETEITGTATCRGLRWRDGIAAGFGVETGLIEEQEPFDAEITFEARP